MASSYLVNLFQRWFRRLHHWKNPLGKLCQMRGGPPLKTWKPQKVGCSETQKPLYIHLLQNWKLKKIHGWVSFLWFFVGTSKNDTFSRCFQRWKRSNLSQCTLSRDPCKARFFGKVAVILQRKNSIWLVVSTPLKNIGQNGNLPQIGVKIKDIWKHHLAICTPIASGQSCSKQLSKPLRGAPAFCPSTREHRTEIFRTNLP